MRDSYSRSDQSKYSNQSGAPVSGHHGLTRACEHALSWIEEERGTTHSGVLSSNLSMARSKMIR